MNRVANLGMTKALVVAKHADQLQGRLLDVGCGSKPYRRLDLPCTEYVGLDIRPVAELVGNMMQIPAEDESFDTVLCVDALQYAEVPHQAVVEMARVLKPGGNLLIVAPSVSVEDEVSFFNFKVNGLGKLCEVAGLTVLELQAASHIWQGEFEQFNAQDKFGFTLAAELHGLVGYLDQNYPAFSVVLATK
jgi:SAM-dependent methyltransferase